MLFRNTFRLLTMFFDRSPGRKPRPDAMVYGFLLSLVVTIGGVTQAQTPIPAPFHPTLSEGHECLPAPAATSVCPGFHPFGTACATAPQATITGLPFGGVLIRGVAGPTLTPFSGSNYLFGLGTDVDILFGDKQFFRKFGGRFSRTNIATGVTRAEFTFTGQALQPYSRT
jgi:hypothetical protein